MKKTLYNILLVAMTAGLVYGMFVRNFPLLLLCSTVMLVAAAVHDKLFG